MLPVHLPCNVQSLFNQIECTKLTSLCEESHCLANALCHSLAGDRRAGHCIDVVANFDGVFRAFAFELAHKRTLADLSSV